jgi:acetyl-CoA acetyltransferase family protein
LAYAAKSVITRDQEIVIASGVESMSRAPYVIGKATRAFQRPAPPIFDTAIGWRFTNPRFDKTYPPLEMGETAEKVATIFNITRAAQDKFAYESHRLCAAAYEKGAYSEHVIPVSQLGDLFTDGECHLEMDENIRKDINAKSLSKLKSAFIRDGTVTAGNSSPLSDGAAALIVASEDACKSLGLHPIARFVSSGVAGVDPSLMGIGPVPATKIALRRAEWRIQDLDVVEINEAFASQTLAVQRELEIPSEILNQHGGAIAIGHPLGASGIRLALTAMFRMKDEDKKSRALLSACVGVGQGESILIEKC